jgi:beta-glucosidase
VDRELKDFRRVSLEAGEKRRVSFDVPHSAFSLVDSEARRVVEPGNFHVLVGSSSRPDDLLVVALQISTEVPIASPRG